MENETIEATDAAYAVMFNGTMFSMALDIISMIFLLLFIVKLFGSSKELAKLTEVDGSRAIFHSVIAAIAIVILGSLIELQEVESIYTVYAESMLEFMSSAVLLYGAFGFSKVVKHFVREG